MGRWYQNPGIARTFDGQNWSSAGVAVQGSTNGWYLNAVAYGAYGGGIFAAVGTMGKILISDDAARWTTRSLSSPYTDSLNGVCYGNGYFVAVGDFGQTITGAGDPVWQVATTLATINKLNAVCYGGGKFVAVGDSGTWLTSTNGQNWTRTYLQTGSGAFLENITDVTYGNGAFAAITPAGSLLFSFIRPCLVVSHDMEYVYGTPGTVSFGVTNIGAGTMNWTASVVAGGSWLRITSGTNGVDAGTILCSYDMNAGASRIATIRVTAAGAAGSPIDLTVQQAAGPPVIIEQPPSKSVRLGFTPGFHAVIEGAEPVSAWWLKGGATLTNGGRFQWNSEAWGYADLSISRIRWEDAGNYQVVLSNIFGIVTSAVAVLTVTPPPTEQLWAFEASSPSDVPGPAIGADGTVYVGSGRDKVLASH